jgi:hypothetical protein
MKAVLDSMLWVSYLTHRNGPRYRAGGTVARCVPLALPVLFCGFRLTHEQPGD